MKNLMIKEMKLAASPLTYFFISSAFLTFLPGYPILVGAFFICLGIFYSFQNAREANDVIYSVMLPVRKTDIVKSKYIFVVGIQAIYFVLVSAITAIRMILLSNSAAYLENQLMNATPFYLAFVLLVLCSFNVFFLGGHYKTAWKIGPSFIVFTVVAFVLILAGEAVLFFPATRFLNVPSGERLGIQFALLGASLVVYAAGTLLSLRSSVRRFGRTDL